MGNGQCCKRVDRVETLQLDDDPSLPENSKRGSLKPSDQAQMMSLSDSEEDYPVKKKPKFGTIKDPQKTSQLSTIQQYSFQSLPSEQHFQNFVTFQALPSQHGLQGNVFQQFQAEMAQIATQQVNMQKNQKKVQFTIQS